MIGVCIPTLQPYHCCLAWPDIRVLQTLAEVLGDDGMAPADTDDAFAWFEKISGVQVRNSFWGCFSRHAMPGFVLVSPAEMSPCST